MKEHCPHCGFHIVRRPRQEQGNCDRCEGVWHLYIETRPVLRAGPLKKQTDEKAASKAKAFVEPTVTS